jgi:hypothetical protein
LWIGLLLIGAADVAAQPPQPIGPYVVDARGALVRFKQDASVATGLEVTADNLPTRGLGIAAGAHWYPLRRGRVTLGLGGELLLARDTRTKEQTDVTVATPTVTTSFSSMTPLVSLNFGTGEGWSYISGGVGLARLTSERDDAPFADSASRVRATNYGGGARWFTSPHLAFTFDLRFYTINAQPSAGTRPAYPRSKFMIISVGVSLR